MSILLTTSPKHCANQERLHHLKKLKKNKKLLYGLSSSILSVLSLVFLIWIVLHPSKPEFYLKDTAVYELAVGAAGPHLLNSTIETTIVSKNPNSRVGVYYDRLRAYAAYNGQQITAAAALPAFYQGNGDTDLLSAFLYGSGVPVEPSFGYEVGRDQLAGQLLLRVRLDGQLRWKVGTWVSGRYRLDVDCAAAVGIRTAGGAGPLISSAQGTPCSTTL